MKEPIFRRIAGGALELVEGDITALRVDAIVNPANTALQLGAGVAGAIRQAGGPTIQEECDRIGHCPQGGAVITRGGDLRARHVIHAVGPVWDGSDPDAADRLLASACREALVRGAENGLGSVALPSISTGVFGFPMDRAARVLLGEAASHLRGTTRVPRVIFCLFGDEAFGVYRAALDELFPG